MSAAASLIERQCQAALLKERLIPLVTLLGAILRKELRGEEQSRLPKDLALAWGQVAERLLTDSGFAAWERKAIARAAARFLDGCAGEIRPSLVSDAAQFRARIAAFGVELAKAQEEETEACLYCACEVKDTEQLPYCSSLCAAQAQRESEGAR